MHNKQVDTINSDRSGMEASRDKMATQTTLPSLSGWRAISILIVLGSHCKYSNGFPRQFEAIFHWLFDGAFGVRCFFSISGFLITYLLLREEQTTGRIDLRRFYLRRAIRILPAYWAFLFILFFLQVVTEFRQSRIEWLGNLLFLSNFTTEHFATGHLWSLAVEEQFYLLWPGLLGLLLVRKSIRVLSAVTCVPILTCPALRAIGYMCGAEYSNKHQITNIPLVGKLLSRNSDWLVNAGQLSHFDSIAIGCLFAVFFVRSGSKMSEWMSRNRELKMGLALVFVLVPYLANKLSFLGSANLLLGNLLQGFGFCFFMVESIYNSGHQLFRLLNTKIFVWIGLLSYSLYLWQQVFCARLDVFGVQARWYNTYPTWLLSALFAACVSYYALEKPFLKLRASLRIRDGGGDNART
jgi:peptidoglycan/LPS O-acetylase OafA/YrhL